MSDTALLTTPDPSRFPPLPAERAERWSRFGRWDRVYFPSFVGLVVEEIRLGYARMRLPWRSELAQPAGVLHGGALATLVDTVVVPAVGGAYDEIPVMFTVSMQVQYLGAVRDEDAVAEGWVVQRGRSTVFCEAAVRTASGTPAATGTLVYTVRPASPTA